MKAKLNKVIQGAVGEKIDKGLIMQALFNEQDTIAQFFDDLIFDKTKVQVLEDTDYSEQYAWLFEFISETICKQLSTKSENAEREVEVDVERIANTLSFYIESGKWQLVSTLINSGDLADVAKAIAEEILKGNVIKVKEEKKY